MLSHKVKAMEEDADVGENRHNNTSAADARLCGGDGAENGSMMRIL